MKRTELYSENIKRMIESTIKSAYFDFRKASDYFWNLDSRGTVDAIEYDDYVKEECPCFNISNNEATFNLPAYDIVKWIVNEGELEINDFINLNEDNVAAMTLLDFVMCEQYYNKVSETKCWI